MNIAVIGAGAMGSLFGGYLSMNNKVWLIDTNAAMVEKVNKDGLTIQEADKEICVHPIACTEGKGLPQMDLVILFVKALYSEAALRANKCLFGENTYVLTLQNGSGHEAILKQYVDESRILIGTTQDNCAVKDLGVVRHGGSGFTYIGGIVKEKSEAIERFIDTFCKSGFDTQYIDNIQYLIWDKLFVNTSVSVLTGILQVKMGFMYDNEHGNWLKERLIAEAVAVANADGFDFKYDDVLAKTNKLLEGGMEGITSICSDLAHGRLTEVETISGSVVRAAKANGTPAPTHECMVRLVHAMEQRGDCKYTK